MHTTIKNFLKDVYSNADRFDEWLQEPVEKSKEWKYEELDEKTIDVLKTTLEYISQEFRMSHVTKHTMKKFNQTSRHSILSFYTSLVMNLLSFLLGIGMLLLGVYACFTDRTLLGFFFCGVGFIQVAYFILAKPIQSLSENINNIVQIEVALSSWLNEMTYWQVFLKETGVEEKQVVAQAMRDACKWVIMLIEDYSRPAGKRSNLDPDKYANFISQARSLMEKLREKQNPSKADKFLPPSSHS